MKNFSKLLAFLLVFCMILNFSVSVFATEEIVASENEEIVEKDTPPPDGDDSSEIIDGLEEATETDVTEPEGIEEGNLDKRAAERGSPIVHTGGLFSFNTIYYADIPGGSYYNYFTKRNVGNEFWVTAMQIKTINGQIVYCLSPEMPSTGTNYVSNTDQWNTMPRDLRVAIRLVMGYGYPNQDLGGNALYQYVATQFILWEYVTGIRNPSTHELVGTGLRGKTAYSSVWSCYDTLVNKIKAHKDLPPYATLDPNRLSSYTYTLEYDSTGDIYQYFLPKEKQGQKNGFDPSLGTGFSYIYASDGKTVIGFSATTSAAEALGNSEKNLEQKTDKLNITRGMPTIWVCGSESQPCIQAETPDPITGYFKLRIAPKQKQFNISLSKVNEKNEPLEGAVFGLYHGDSKMDEMTTNAAGVATSQNFDVCDSTCTKQWFVKELAAPYGYQLDDTKHYVAPNADTEIALQSISIGPFKNAAKHFNVSLEKKDDKGNLVGGAKYGIYHGDELIETLTTSSEKAVLSKDIIFCDKDCSKEWYVKEISAPYGWLLDTEKHAFTPNADKTTDIQTIPVSVTEQPKAFSVIVRKADKDGKPLSGAVFALYHGNDLMETLPATDSNGNAAAKKSYAYCDENCTLQWYLVETKAPEGYIENFTTHYVVKPNESDCTQEIFKYTVNVTNDVIKGGIDLYKVDKLHPEKSLSDAKFVVYTDVNKNGKYEQGTDTLYGALAEKDGETGHYCLSDVVYGRYLVHETQAPEGYDPDPGYYSVSIVTNGKIETVSNYGEDHKFGNVPISGSAEIFKFDADYPDNKLTGAEFTIYNDVDGDGKHSDADTVFGKMVEDKTGHYVIEDLPYGKYLVNETVAPEGYLRDENFYSFEIDKTGQIEELENGEVGKGFGNEKIHGNVEIFKYDEDYPDNLLTGASFAIYLDKDANGEYDSKVDKLIGLMTEDYEGHYVYNDLEYGYYLLHEEEAPVGFDHDDNYYGFRITEDGSVEEVSNTEAGKGFFNSPLHGMVEVFKFDEDYPDRVLSGAEFTVYNDVDGNGEYAEATDTIVGKLTEEADNAGHYILDDLRFGNYLLKETAAPEYYEADENYYPFVIDAGGKICTISNVSAEPVEGELTEEDIVTGFYDDIVEGECKIIKTASDKKVDGITFHVTGKTVCGDEFDKEFVTDKDGIITFSVRPGTYKIEEVKNEVTKGYVIPVPQTVEIKSGETKEVTFLNVPKTGDEFSALPYFIAAGVCVLGMGVLLVILAVKKKQLAGSEVDDDDDETQND